MFEQFPYTDMHQLNLDWIVKIAKDFLDQYTHLQQLITDGETSLTNLTQQGLDSIQEQYTNINNLLETWYTTHSADIANQLADALNTLQTTLATMTNTFNTAAERRTNELIATIPLDYSDLALAVETLIPKRINLFNPAVVEFGYLSGTGEVTPNANYVCSDYIDIHDLHHLTLSRTHIACWYDANKTFISMVTGMDSLTNDYFIENVPGSAYYIRFSTNTDYRYTAQIGISVSRNDYVDYKYYTLPFFIDTETEKEFNVRWANMFNKDHTIVGYLSGTGGIINNSGFITSDYIPVIPGQVYTISNTQICAWFDANYDYISFTSPMDSLAANATITAPASAAFIRISAPVARIDAVQVGCNIPRNKYYEYKKQYYLPDMLDIPEIVIDKNGNGDYTSFTQAFLDNKDITARVIVRHGTYDIKQEYIDIFGQSAIENIGSNSAGFDGFQDGIKIHNKHIIFDPGARLKCDWTNVPINNPTFRLSILCIYPNVKIERLYAEATGLNYVIHDDYGTPDNTPFTVEYYNCTVLGWNLRGANCIGGGCHKYSTHIIKDCYFDNHVNSTDIVLSADLRYHNTSVADAEPEVYVSNCRFSNNANFCYYGPQQTIMRVYVNNCYAPKGINKVRESVDYNVDNIYLYSWNNQQQ